MTDSANDRPRSSLAVWLAALSLLLVVYPLSVGPAVCLSNHGYIPESALTIYKPLDLVAWICPPAKWFFRWWLVVWQRLWPPF
jgi:hypothetical protein